MPRQMPHYPIVLLVKHPNRFIVPFLRHATSPPHNDDDVVELSESPYLHRRPRPFKGSAGRPSDLTAFRFANARIASSTSYLDGTPSSSLHGGRFLRSSTMLGSRVGYLVLSNILSHLTHRSRMRALSRSNRPSSSLIYCELNVLFPYTSFPCRCL